MYRIKYFLMICLIFISCAKIQLKNIFQIQLFETNWTMYAGNPARTNFFPGDISLPLEPVWRFKASAAIEQTLLIDDGVVFFTTMDGNIYALNISTGKKIGHKKIVIHATSILHDSLLFIARRYGDNTLFRYNLSRGKFDWQINAGDISSEPIILDNQIVVTALYKHIDLYDINSGTKIWQFETDDQIHSSPASNGEAIFFGCDNGYLYALSRKDGVLDWKFKTNAAVQSTPTIKNETVFIGSSDFYFYALNLHSGQLKWKFKTEGQLFHAAAANDSLIIFGSTDAQVYCLNQFSGELVWKFKANSVISTCPLIVNNKVFFGSLDRHYYAVDISAGKKLWQYETKGRIRTAPVVWGDYLIGASEDNYVYAFAGAEEK